MPVDVSSLVNSVKGDVITPDHPDYDSAIARWAKNAERKAGVVVRVKDADDVAQCIAFAKANKLPIAVRGGGHNAAGASSSDGGLVIDLHHYLRQVRVDVEQKLGYVGGGALWKDVDEEAIKYGLATVGGTVNHTGVGGLTLGGGYGWLTGRHGLTIDNLVQVTIVTADGSVLTANETENTDLFWAVRGGGGNFGVATEFVYRLHPQRKTIFAGYLVFTPDKVERLVEVTKKWWDQVKADDEAMIQMVGAPHGRPAVATCLFYNGSEEEGRANFKEFYDLGPVKDDAKEIPYEEINTLHGHTVDHGKCFYLKGVCYKYPDVGSITEVLKKSEEIAKRGDFATGMMFEYFPLGKANAVPVSATAFRRELGSNLLTLVHWEGHPEKTGEARDLANELIDIVMKGPGALTKSQQGYTNYGHDIDPSNYSLAAPTVDHAAQRSEAAFASNYPRLQTLKKRYDPDNLFDRWFPITPA